MNARQGRKLFAGIGLVSMLVGALMVVAPVGAGAAPSERAGNPSCAEILGELGYTDIGEAKFEQGDDTEAPYPADLTEYAVAGGAFLVEFRLDEDGVRFRDATKPVYAVAIKKGSAGQDFSVTEFFPAGVTEGFVAYDEGSFSNVKFCTGTPPTDPDPQADLTIVKVIDAEEPDDEVEFDFTFQPGDDEEDFSLSHEATKSFGDLEPGSYVVTETEHDDYDLTGVACFAGEDVPLAEDAYSVTGTTLTVSLEDGDDVTCVFTNAPEVDDVPPPPPPPPPPPGPALGALSIDKVVTGLGAPGISTAYGFTVDCGTHDLTPGVEGNVASFTLRRAQAPRVFTNIPAGTSCTVSETEDHGAATTTYAVNGVGGATATIVSGATQAVVVTNDFPAVLPSEEEPPPVVPPVAPPVDTPPVVTPPVVVPTPQAPAPQVMGDVVTRTLPRTGNESRDLAAFGAGLLFLGAGLVLASRARYARIG